MGVLATVTMDTEMFIFCACADATFTAVYQLCGWIKAWFILFSYSAWLWNKGVRIIEVFYCT